MNDFISKIRAEAQKNPARIVFADFEDQRILDAAKIIESEGLAYPILKLEDPQKYVAELSKLRKISLEEAREKLKDKNYLATMMVKMGDADAMIGGPLSSSHERILPALEIIKTKKAGKRASAFNFMILDSDTNPDAANGGILLFADVALNIDPTSEELAQIAINTAESAKRFGIEPKIAMLSFSTAGSTQDVHTEKVRKATEIIRHKRSDLPVEGQIQVDAALMDNIARIKMPKSRVAGHANILIFPDLEAGNIAYKLVERLANAKVIGPIIQGLNKPVNEVSRGASVEDIVNLAATTSLQVSFN